VIDSNASLPLLVSIVFIKHIGEDLRISTTTCDTTRSLQTRLLGRLYLDGSPPHLSRAKLYETFAPGPSTRLRCVLWTDLPEQLLKRYETRPFFCSPLPSPTWMAPWRMERTAAEYIDHAPPFIKNAPPKAGRNEAGSGASNRNRVRRLSKSPIVRRGPTPIRTPRVWRMGLAAT